MFAVTESTPTEICAAIEKTTRKRAATEKAKPVRDSQRAPIAEGQPRLAAQLVGATRNPIANGRATLRTQPTPLLPIVSNPIAGQHAFANQKLDSGNPIPDAAIDVAQPTDLSPHQEPLSTANKVPQPWLVAPWTSEHVSLAPYSPTPAVQDAVAEIVTLHRLRQGMIKAQTKLKLQGMASIRFATQTDEDFADDTSKAKARKRNEDLYRKLSSEILDEIDRPGTEQRAFAVIGILADCSLKSRILPYLIAMEPLDAQRAVYEKDMVKAVKRLPVYAWAKGVKGFGDISLATIVGECGDIGTYRSVSAVWKRMGVAVIAGKRQGNPGAGASAEDWIEHGYNAQRRSVGYVAREHVIGGMGKWRPDFGSGLADATYYQRIYAERARLECVKLGMPLTCSDKGKESYKKHVSNRAHRYVEKRLLKHLYLEWRRA